jgi:hypothetical protein
LLGYGSAVRWPEKDLMAMESRDGSYHLGSAICRRGHVETDYLRPGVSGPVRRSGAGVAQNCPKCGATVLTACPNCDLRIRGDYFVPGVIAASTASRPSFRDGCGSAFPWATREERIFELENLLDEEDIEEADRVVIQDQLRRLGNAELTEKDERQAWSVIGRRAGAALKSPSVARLLGGLVMRRFAIS